MNRLRMCLAYLILFGMRSSLLGISPILITCTLTLAACGMPATVGAGSGPAGGSSTSSSSASDDSGTTAKFGQKFTYPDGVEVEVTKVETAKVGAYALIGDKQVKKGTSFTKFSVRVRNGSKDTLDTVGSTQLHYGADGDEAEQVFDGSKVPQEISGKVVKGKSKTGVYGYVVPKKSRNDVQFEFTMDFEHDAVVFSGKV